MRPSKEALRHAMPPGRPGAPVRQAKRLHLGEPPEPGSVVRRSGLVGQKLIDCGCPLAAEPHSRHAHAEAELRRDCPALLGGRGLPP